MFLSFDEFIDYKSPLLEMAVEGDAVKTPILFDKADISYLMQFPSDFWAGALKARYNDLLLPAKRKFDEFKQENPEKSSEEIAKILDQQNPTMEVKIPFDRRRKTATFKINPRIFSLVNKLEKDRDLDKLSQLHPHERDQYQAGHYGYDMGGEVRDEQDKELVMTRGYVPMTIETATKALKNWRSAINSGWLGKLDNAMKVKNSHVFTPQQLQMMGINSPNGRQKFNFEVQGEDGQSQPASVDAHIPVMYPGKLIDAKSVKKYDQLIQQATTAQNETERNQFLEEAEQVKNNAKRYSPFEWNIHKYNQTRENGKRLYQPLNTKVMTLGGFNPNKQQAEKLVGTDQDWNDLEQYVVGRYDDASASYFVLGHNSTEIQKEINVQKANLQQVKSPNERKEIERYIHILEKQRWLKHGSIRRGISNLLAQPQFKSSYEYYVVNTMFDDMVQVASLELKDKIRHPSVVNFLKALRNNASSEELYQQFDRFVMRHAFDFAARVIQLDWGRGTRRKRNQVGTISLQQMINNNSGEGISLEDLIEKHSKPSSGSSGSMKLKRGERKYRRPGGVYSDEQIYFGHNIQNVIKTIIQRNQDKPNMANTSKELEVALSNEIGVRGEIFDELVQLYIATQIKLKRNWNLQAAYEFAKKNLEKVLLKRGAKISSAPDELINKDQSDGNQQHVNAKLAADKAEILKDLGQSSQMSYKGDEAEKELLDPNTLNYVKSNPKALKAMEDKIAQETDPMAKSQMQQTLMKIKQALGIAVEPAAVDKDQVQKRVATDVLITRLVRDPAVRAQVANLAPKNPALAAALAKANEILKKAQ